ncbi:uncharacterized protein LOC121238143 [Juglans microcarpa x Juglans regia]|uniref:uncharacterized protein LOC121238143 n=1 Tax=Juglans microcarpa x Juglans regia TaxID=2249226 RepID=UPI001B7F6C13|nr:uncharacterized protein LOC121238143 [Juglans microcarpa x Juglans regia]
MKERREKGLYYYRDAKWGPGHKCQNLKLYLLEEVLVENEGREVVTEEREEECAVEVLELDNQTENPEISLHALTGSHNPKIMRLKGILGNQWLTILVDTGSTHNFLHPVVERGRLTVDCSEKVKDEIELIVQELLKFGVIQPSQSLYSSPVLLVRKADGSWKLCVHYSGLNGVTAKNKFPIPVVEELMNELHDAVIFSKLCLRFGYHQIRVKPFDVPKTSFRTRRNYKISSIAFRLN